MSYSTNGYGNGSIFLEQFGFGAMDLGYLAAVMAVVMAIMILLMLILMILFCVQIGKTKRLKRRLDKFMTSTEGKSLEREMEILFQDNVALKASTEENKKNIRTLFKNMESAYQKLGIVKYDAFKQMGGQLSFSLALLDENNNGFILNSVHSSEGCYSYTKEIKLGKSEISLGAEEAQALTIAIGRK